MQNDNKQEDAANKMQQQMTDQYQHNQAEISRRRDALANQEISVIKSQGGPTWEPTAANAMRNVSREGFSSADTEMKRLTPANPQGANNDS